MRATDVPHKLHSDKSLERSVLLRDRPIACRQWEGWLLLFRKRFLGMRDRENFGICCKHLQVRERGTNSAGNARSDAPLAAAPTPRRPG